MNLYCQKCGTPNTISDTCEKCNIQNKTDEELKTLKTEIEDELSQRILNRDESLLEQAKLSTHPALIAIAEAMMACKHKIKPEIFEEKYKKQPGYFLADCSRQTDGFRDLEPLFENPSTKDVKLAKTILKHFEISDFIFSHTHYDNCDNGFYFRRS